MDEETEVSKLVAVIEGMIGDTMPVKKPQLRIVGGNSQIGGAIMVDTKEIANGAEIVMDDIDTARSIACLLHNIDPSSGIRCVKDAARKLVYLLDSIHNDVDVMRERLEA